MTDITELARRVEHIISDMKLKHGDKDTYAPVMKWDEFLALVEALEKAQVKNALVAGGTEATAKLHERITELESEVEKWKQEAEAWEQVAEKQLATAIELESRTVTVKLPYTPEPSAFAPWAAKAFYQFHKDTVKSCAEAFSEACSAAGVKLEIK